MSRVSVSVILILLIGCEEPDKFPHIDASATANINTIFNIITSSHRGQVRNGEALAICSGLLQLPRWEVEGMLRSLVERYFHGDSLVGTDSTNLESYNGISREKYMEINDWAIKHLIHVAVAATLMNECKTLSERS
jgi:hypothetical protein